MKTPIILSTNDDGSVRIVIDWTVMPRDDQLLDTLRMWIDDLEQLYTVVKLDLYGASKDGYE